MLKWTISLVFLLVITYSVMMDIDQAARRNAQEYFNIIDPDYYTFDCKYIKCDFTTKAMDSDPSKSNNACLSVLFMSVANGSVTWRGISLNTSVRY